MELHCLQVQFSAGKEAEAEQLCQPSGAQSTSPDPCLQPARADSALCSLRLWMFDPSVLPCGYRDCIPRPVRGRELAKAMLVISEPLSRTCSSLPQACLEMEGTQGTRTGVLESWAGGLKVA